MCGVVFAKIQLRAIWRETIVGDRLQLEVMHGIVVFGAIVTTSRTTGKLRHRVFVVWRCDQQHGLQIKRFA